VRLPGFARRRIWELSGGQQQRVALARALINRPTVLLLDEPLAALDRKLRREMQIELQNLQREVGITFVLVTHDQEEALSMSDTIGIMRDGRIEQFASPRELYDAPANRAYTMTFLPEDCSCQIVRCWPSIFTRLRVEKSNLLRWSLSRRSGQAADRASQHVSSPGANPPARPARY